ncbi:CidA/LrgA family protein [Aliarcobacter butzleri]|uniref:LrgA n=1 Tax=Aliarcobacter butzleri L351 TaxID=1447259 RepID=A0A837J2F5_9BACT|nr:CidA/LrgA family protein [Aliarcobacter butzleri]KLD99459.1 LrgA [Aliarcobacter butzleri L351]KLE12380.1 LrgA [Aliarcobacter butzleri L350]MCG3671308.1 CidA/LrgA family protein [Aliarcobacter butzleri]MCG3709901.1 CidA/LrgA family protein [Aliarcobacter butzleri]MCT7561228.1 CidA/LrgA family protein [Aliarcobacter butzleri]
MLKGIIVLLVFQFLGECISKFFTLLVPGPVIGMVLLLVFLIIKKGSFHSLDNAVALHLRYLPLLFIPAAMGIITQIDIITKEFWAIFIALFFGTLIALIFAAKFMDFLTSKVNKDEL